MTHDLTFFGRLPGWSRVAPFGSLSFICRLKVGERSEGLRPWPAGVVPGGDSGRGYLMILWSESFPKKPLA